MSGRDASVTGLPLDVSRALRDLLTETEASRATLRLDVVGMNFPVVGEAVNSVDALSGNHSLDQRNLDTVRYLFRTHDLLVQDDCQAADPAPPTALITTYGVKAQMLAPVIDRDRVLGWVSVHDCTRSRSWRESDVRALRQTVHVISQTFLGVGYLWSDPMTAPAHDEEGNAT
jgi:GAF domain-containing protein